MNEHCEMQSRVRSRRDAEIAKYRHESHHLQFVRKAMSMRKRKRGARADSESHAGAAPATIFVKVEQGNQVRKTHLRDDFVTNIALSLVRDDREGIFSATKRNPRVMFVVRSYIRVRANMYVHVRVYMRMYDTYMCMCRQIQYKYTRSHRAHCLPSRDHERPPRCCCSLR